jgi:membrane-bound serine protease (ClpP class)
MFLFSKYCYSLFLSVYLIQGIPLLLYLPQPMKVTFLFLAFLFSLKVFPAKVVTISIDGTINPVTAEFIHNSIIKANSEHAECLIIHLNTPGGLLKSTRVIVSEILESPVPVIVYVSPAGAQSGSAGVFITLAAHIAAMSPGTNMGAAHPVDMQGQKDSIMNTKATNDAAAFIRTIAERRKRNVQWAEQAVRNSVSITENEALQKKVIDLIAPSTNDLLKKIDNRRIQLANGYKTLHTRQAKIEAYEMGITQKILDKISDPNIAYILVLIGLYGILFELYSPGAILPGIVGVISLILSFYSLHTLPVNYAGLALIVFAIVLFLLEVKIASHGVLAIGGIVSLLLGSVMLFRADTSLEFVKLSWTVIISSVAMTSFFFLFVIGLGLRAQRLRPVTGLEGLLGDTGESLDLLDPAGTVQVHGEIWQAESTDGRIDKGEKIRVVGITNLKLHVAHLNS